MSEKQNKKAERPQKVGITLFLEGDALAVVYDEIERIKKDTGATVGKGPTINRLLCKVYAEKKAKANG